MELKNIGDTGLRVTPLSFGTSAMGDMPDTYGYPVGEEQAAETIKAIFEGPVNFLDTSNNYGFGRSEERIGTAIRAHGGLPEGFVLATKLDRDMESGRFDAARVRQSLEESLARLGLDRIHLLHLHDPEHARDLREITCRGGALEELFKLREEGLAEAVGLAMGRIDMQFPLLREWPFDALINHNRYTLLNRSANQMFDFACERGMAILNAAPYAGGILAKGSANMRLVTYQDATNEALSHIGQIEAICARHGVTTGEVALQFSMRDQRITSTIVGVSKPSRVVESVKWAKRDIPSELWDEILSLNYSKEDPEANRKYRPG